MRASDDKPADHAKPGTRRGTVSAGFIRTLLDAFAREYGGHIQRAAVLAQAGIADGALEAPEARVPVEVVARVWAAVQARTRDRMMGLKVARHVRPGSFGVLGHLLMTSATLGEAFERAAEFAALVGDGGVLAVDLGGGDAVLAYDLVDRDLPCREERIEALLSALVAFVRWITGHDVVPRAVRFAHPSPGYRGAFLGAFGIEPSFEACDNAVVISARHLELPLLQADPELCAVLAAHARKVLARLTDEDPVIRLVRQAIMAQMAWGPPTLAGVALSLAMPTRRLQRRLADRGTSFQEQLASARRHLALDHLGRGNKSIGEVAALSGFADVPSFHRAFKRWTGMTPGQWLASAEASAAIN